MASEEIFVNVIPGETRVAITLDGRLNELFVARKGSESIEGNLYLGRVLRVVPGIEAAFVEIGLEGAGFLGAAEARIGENGEQAARRISSSVTEGEAIIVQASADPVGDKGARLTTRVTLPGRCLVFTPFRAGVSVSRRIEDEATVKRLHKLLKDEMADGTGFIARTRATTASDDDLTHEARMLSRQWSAVLEKRKDARPPALLHTDQDPVRRVLRERADEHIRRAVIDDARALAELRPFWEEELRFTADRLEAYTGSTPLFEAVGIEEQIDAVLESEVPLPSGGSLIIEETAALSAIDVNSGTRVNRGTMEGTAIATNLEAAVEAARQIRLRNLGGQMVIDFLPMKRVGNREKLLHMLRRGVSTDRGTTHVFGFTRLGLVEMTRRRRGRSLAHHMLGVSAETPPPNPVKSAEAVAFEIVRALLHAARINRGKAVSLTAAPEVVAMLEGPLADVLAETEARLGGGLKFDLLESGPRDRFRITPAGAHVADARA